MEIPLEIEMLEGDLCLSDLLYIQVLKMARINKNKSSGIGEEISEGGF